MSYLMELVALLLFTQPRVLLLGNVHKRSAIWLFAKRNLPGSFPAMIHKSHIEVPVRVQVAVKWDSGLVDSETTKYKFFFLNCGSSGR